MKTRLATALSILGVIGAGTVATAVNTSVLSGGAATDPATPVLALSADESSPAESSFASEVEAAPLDDVVDTTVAPSAAAAAAATTAAPAGAQTTFNVGDAGAVTVDTVDGRLVLVSADAREGWTPGEVIADDSVVEATYHNGATLVRVRITLVDGQPTATVESNNLDGSGVDPTAPIAAPTPIPAAVQRGSANAPSAGASGVAPAAAAPGATPTTVTASAPSNTTAPAPVTTQVVVTTAAPATTSTVADRYDDDEDDRYYDDDHDDDAGDDDDHDDDAGDDDDDYDDDDHDDDDDDHDDDHEDDD